MLVSLGCETEAVPHFPLLHRHHGRVVATIPCERMVGLGLLCTSVRCCLALVNAAAQKWAWLERQLKRA